MCVVAFSNIAHPRWLYVVAGNRDELHARPATPLGRWPDQPDIIAGRDLQSGGTWLGVSEQGRIAVVTNMRGYGEPQPERMSRGTIVTDMLTGEGHYANPGAAKLNDFNPFNLIVANRHRSEILCNRPEPLRLDLPSAVYGLSNGALDEPWPKTLRLSNSLKQWLANDQAEPTQLLEILSDDVLPPDDPSPHTAIFVRNAVYGTRCSTVVAIDHDGIGTIIERRFDADSMFAGEDEIAFRWPVD